MGEILRENQNKKLLLEMSVVDGEYDFTSSIVAALSQAELEIHNLDETIESIQCLKPNCDKLDYILAASSGALCGIIDIFLVGKPGESPLGDITDKWFANRTTDFAKLYGWEDKGENSLSSAIRFLENKFKIPYDQRGAGDAASSVFDLSPTNHHFKSLAHNPSLLGLFFSILDQFTNSSHFISGGELISLVDADEKFELRGNNIPSKLFCAFTNWFGHLISDMSGSAGSKGRGMGIPSPLWTWTNDIIALKRTLNIPVSQFDNSINELAVNIYNKGYDARFQSAQAIPVFINEMLVRLVFAIRRLIKYFAKTNKENRSFSLMWKKCEPFSNPTVKRMLTVAHGTFCLIDIGDATVRGFVTGAGSFNPTEFFLRLNIVGVGRLTISLYGEVKREIGFQKAEREIIFARKEKLVVENYIEGLQLLSQLYEDKNLLNFITDFKNSDMYIHAFEKSVLLARKRNVKNNEILKNKMEIDSYFLGGNKV
ncbi:hypothetical protein [Evansella cellulosilytica]|uniref:Uncharacterized protein n=1 Tax=Evansella cellulosilytica (strain ATCC 21833 / DSM 2522 / FERM P-1141 / JCM 9156 / N-4) TaxID=649639 RepID=E6TR37_EVAC2|nr:hypothetical protein [Evansella cellulosilytica]ADU29413.1 hypothetical protein Bcell_1145 [Evansella cellulosilytica DSM 2522]